MMTGLKLLARFTAFAAFMAMFLVGALPALSQEDKDTERERQDMNIGNSGQLRTGQDERGNEVMEITPKPKTQQQMPDIGPIYVYPEVNTGGRGGVIPPGPGPRHPRTPQTMQTPPTPRTQQTQPHFQSPEQQRMQPGNKDQFEGQSPFKRRMQPGQQDEPHLQPRGEQPMLPKPQTEPHVQPQDQPGQ